MKKIISNSLLILSIIFLVISCSSDDDSSSSDSSINTIKPSKISLQDKYWTFEYDGNRLTSLKKFDIDFVLPLEEQKFYYNSSNELESIALEYSNGSIVNYNYTFENGFLKRVEKPSNLVVIPDLHIDIIDYFYNNNNQVIKIKRSIWSTPEPAQIPVTNNIWTEFYTYDANGNLETYSSGDENEQNVELVYTYYYNDTNHPFKNIDIRVQPFLQLPTFNFVSINGYPGQFIFSEFSTLTSVNNLTFTRYKTNSALEYYSFSYNDDNFPVESQGNVISQRLKIEY